MLIGFAFFVAGPKKLSPELRKELSKSFSFETVEIKPNVRYGQIVRGVNQYLSRLDTWVSSIGASTALADLDGDGLANDMCIVDPRSDLVQIRQVPGPFRYEPVVLSYPDYYYPESMAPFGCIMADFDENGTVDLAVNYAGRPPVIYLQVNERVFEPIEILEKNVMTLHWTTAAMIAADVNGDGHLDLIVGNYFEDEATTFDRDSEVKFPKMPNSFSTALNGGSNKILINTLIDSKNFRLVFKEVDLELDDKYLDGWTLAAGAADLDGDLLPEIYIGNDFGPDRLFHNRSTPDHVKLVPVEGRDTLDRPHSFVLGKDSYKGMGIDFQDVNKDGRLDFAVSNVSQHEFVESHYLFLSEETSQVFQKGIAPYGNHGMKLGFYDTGWGWGVRLADFNNDGVLELIQATGFIKGEGNDQWPEFQELSFTSNLIMHFAEVWPRINLGDDISGHQRNPFMVKHEGRFYDISPELGMSQPRMSRGISIGDVDGDGDQDIVMAHQYEGFHLFRNTASNPGKFIGLRLLQPLDDFNNVFVHHKGLVRRPGLTRTAFGSTATIHFKDGSKQIAHVDGGSGHTSQTAPYIHFGLGKVSGTEVHKIELNWRDRRGKVHRKDVQLAPGWHTIVLGERSQT